MQCFHKRTSKSKALQWERRDLLSRMRPKCGPNLDILRTISRYFHQNAVKSLEKHILRQKCDVIYHGRIVISSHFHRAACPHPCSQSD